MRKGYTQWDYWISFTHALMTTVSPEIEKTLIAGVERMPAFPKSAQEILAMTRNLDCSPRDLVSVIEKDPVITMKVLRVVNSPQLGLSNKIMSLNQSVVYLGQNTIKNLALSVAAIGILQTSKVVGFDVRSFLTHSLTTAAFARKLCGVYAPGEADSGECYIAGLLLREGPCVGGVYALASSAPMRAARNNGHSGRCGQTAAKRDLSRRLHLSFLAATSHAASGCLAVIGISISECAAVDRVHLIVLHQLT